MNEVALISALIVLVYSALQLSALYCAWLAVSSSRTSQGALGWVVFLITMPIFGVPLYLFLGHHKFKRYLIGRKGSAELVASIDSFHDTYAPKTPLSFATKALERIAGFETVRGNDMRLLVDGAATFDAIFDAIDQARDYILVQFYIVHDDTLGRALRDRLIAATNRGVSVWFVSDRVGSHKLPQDYRDALTTAGVVVIEPKQMQGPKFRFQLNFRNHRKTVIVDGKFGFTGGLNVGDEYMGRNPTFGAWRDTHVEICGPTVSQLQLVFVEDWHWATDENLIPKLNWKPVVAKADMAALISPTGPGDDMETGVLFFCTLISNAKKRVWIASPYFVPDTDVLSALKIAALQGVDVRILVPDVIDHRLPWLAAFAYFDEIREAGVQVWRYSEGFMHQKVVLVDDTLAAIGTANLDNRSFRLNFETMAVFIDARAATDTAAMLEADFARSHRLETNLADQTAYIRYGAPFARLFAPIL